MNREPMLDEITTYRNQILKQKEKTVFKQLSSLYQEHMKNLMGVISSLFANAKSGTLTKEDLFRYNRNDVLKKKVQESYAKLGKEEQKVMTESLKEVIQDEYLYQSFLATTFALTNKTPKALTPSEVDTILSDPWYGETYRDTLKKDKSAQADTLHKGLVVASLATMNLFQAKKLVRDVSETGLKKSLLNVQTETHKKVSDAGVIFNEKTGLKGKYRIIVTYDERTCRQCSAQDNALHEKDPTPFHPRCRCRAILDIYGKTDWRQSRDPKNGRSILTNATSFQEWKDRHGIKEKTLTYKKPNLTKKERENKKKITEKKKKIATTKSTPRKKPITLSDREEFALESYTADKYRSVNESLRKGKALEKDGEKKARDLDDALKKLPKHTSVTYRNVNFTYANTEDFQKFLATHGEGSIVTYNEYIGTSRNEHSFGNSYLSEKSVKVIIHGTSGRDVSPFSVNQGAEEVLFQRNTTFLVESVRKDPTNGATLITLVEA